MKCFRCNANVIWQNDYDTEDCGYEEEGIVSIYFCSDCNTDYEVISWFGECE